MNYSEKAYKNLMKNGGGENITDDIFLSYDKEKDILTADIWFIGSGLPDKVYVIKGRRKDVIKKEIEAAVKDYFLKLAETYTVKWKF